MSASDYYENVLLDYIFSGTTYLALSTADPTEDGSGIAEPTDEEYARATVLAAVMGSANGGSITNASAITYSPTSESWGTISHFAFFDAATDGNMLIYGAFTTPILVDTLDTANIASSALTVSLT
jgi:hypothetical protein